MRLERAIVSLTDQPKPLDEHLVLGVPADPLPGSAFDPFMGSNTCLPRANSDVLRRALETPPTTGAESHLRFDRLERIP